MPFSFAPFVAGWGGVVSSGALEVSVGAAGALGFADFRVERELLFATEADGLFVRAAVLAWGRASASAPHKERTTNKSPLMPIHFDIAASFDPPSGILDRARTRAVTSVKTSGRFGGSSGAVEGRAVMHSLSIR